MSTSISKHGVSGIVKIEPEDDEIIFLPEPPPPLRKKQAAELVEDDDTIIVATADAPVVAPIVASPASSSTVASGPSASDILPPKTHSCHPIRQATHRTGQPLPSFQRRVSAPIVSEPNPTKFVASVAPTMEISSAPSSSLEVEPQTRPVSLLSRIQSSTSSLPVHTPTRTAPILSTSLSMSTTGKLLQRPSSPSSRPTDPRRAIRPRKLNNQTSIVQPSQPALPPTAPAAQLKLPIRPTYLKSTLPVRPAPVRPTSAPSAPLIFQPAPPLTSQTITSKNVSVDQAKAKAAPLPPSYNVPSSSVPLNPPLPMPAPTLPVDMSVFHNPDMSPYLHAFSNSHFDSYPYLPFPQASQATGIHSVSTPSYAYYNTYPFDTSPPQYFSPTFMTGHNFPSASHQQFGHSFVHSPFPAGQSFFPPQNVHPVPQRTFQRDFPSCVYPTVSSSAQSQSETMKSQKNPQYKEPPLPNISIPISRSSVSSSPNPSLPAQQPPILLARMIVKDTSQPSGQASSLPNSIQTANPAGSKSTPTVSSKEVQVVVSRKPPDIPNSKPPDTAATEVGTGKLSVQDQSLDGYQRDQQAEPKSFPDPTGQQISSKSKYNESFQVVPPSSHLNSRDSETSAEDRGRLMDVNSSIPMPQTKLLADELKPELKLELKPDSVPKIESELDAKPGIKPGMEIHLKQETESRIEINSRESLQERFVGERKFATASRSKPIIPLPSSAPLPSILDEPSGKLFKEPSAPTLITATATSPPPSQFTRSSSSILTQSSRPAGPPGILRPNFRGLSPLRKDIRSYRDTYPSPPPRRREYRRDWHPYSPPRLRREPISGRGRGRSRSPGCDRYEPGLNDYRRSSSSPSYTPSPPPPSRIRRGPSPHRDYIWSSTRHSRSPVPYERRSPPRRSPVDRVSSSNRVGKRTLSPPRSRIRDDSSRIETGQTTKLYSGLSNLPEFNGRGRERETSRDWELDRWRKVDRDQARVTTLERQENEARAWESQQQRHRQVTREQEARERLQERELNRPRPRLSEANTTVCRPAMEKRQILNLPVVSKPAIHMPQASDGTLVASVTSTRPQPSEQEAERKEFSLVRIDPVDTPSPSSSFSRSLEFLDKFPINDPSTSQDLSLMEGPPPSDNQPEVDEVEFLLDDTHGWSVHPVSIDQKENKEIDQRNAVSGSTPTPSTLSSSSRLANRSSPKSLLVESLCSAIGEPVKNDLSKLSSPVTEKKKKKKKKRKSGIKAGNNCQIGNSNLLNVSNNSSSNGNDTSTDQSGHSYNKRMNNNNNRSILSQNAMVTDPVMFSKTSIDLITTPLPNASTSSTPPPRNTPPVTPIVAEVADEMPTPSYRTNPLIVRLMSTEPVLPQRRLLPNRAGVLSTRNTNEVPGGWSSPSSLISRLWNRRSR